MTDKEFKIKITDFSISLILKKEDNYELFSADGNVYFTAPENFFSIDKGFKGKPTDIWTLGISLFLYVTKTLPFEGES